MKEILFLILTFLPILSFSQKYSKYISHPCVGDSVAFFTYAEGFRKKIQDSIYIDKEVKGVDLLIKNKIEQKCHGKIFPFYFQLDSTFLEDYKREVRRMQKVFSIQGCIMDRYYLQIYKFRDSFVTELKKSGCRFFMGTYYHYAYNDSSIQSYLIQNNKLRQSRGEGPSEIIGSQRYLIFFVIDLNTSYPVYYQMSHSKHFRATPPTMLDIDLDFYSVRRFFRGIKKLRYFKK